MYLKVKKSSSEYQSLFVTGKRPTTMSGRVPELELRNGSYYRLNCIGWVRGLKHVMAIVLEILAPGLGAVRLPELLVGVCVQKLEFDVVSSFDVLLELLRRESVAKFVAQRVDRPEK